MHHYQSNRLESLFAQLLANCISAPLADPFTPEVIVVQHPGMAQWISREWALATGIASQLFFPLPARALGEFLQQFSAAGVPDDLWQSAVLRWRILKLLPEYSADPAFAQLAVYLRNDVGSEILFQLAGRIAAVFDQYLVYRPELLLQWESTSDRATEQTNWQAVLWRRLCQDSPVHRARLHQEFRHQLGQRGSAALASGKALPQRLHLFGISSLAPVYLDLFVQISRYIETHCYQLSPCSEYWHDLVPARQLAQVQAQDALLAFSTPVVEKANTLLALLGQAGRDFARQLLESGLDSPQELYEGPQGTSVLAELQRQILNCSPMPAQEDRIPIVANDRSLELHVCFSPLREVQVLHDYLLDCFQGNPDLTPGDILVTAPDISLYAAAVQAVFGEAPQELFIPWALSDQPLVAHGALDHLFLALLDLFSSRCTSTEVLGLLEHPALHRRFGLDASQLPLVHDLVQNAGIRWGLDAEHRLDLGIACGPEHSWRHGLDRLLLGHAMGSLDALHASLLPCRLAGEGADQVLASLLHFYDTLDTWRRRLQQPLPAQEWPPLLLALLADCLHPSFEEEGLGLLRQNIQALAEELALAAFDQLLTLQVIRLHLEESLHSQDSGQAFLSGRVTFCNMVPMRSLPFQVICLLGMNDGDFPRQQYPVSFDYVAQHPRLGDRKRRDDDRYLFLEAILSARKQLFLSWIGRNQRDGSAMQPSAVVSELCDYLDSCMQVAAETAETVDVGKNISEHLRREHPLQPFSAGNYNGTTGSASFNPYWVPAAEVGARLSFQKAPLPPANPPGLETQVDLAELLRFWQNPARYFLQQNLKMSLQEGEALVEEEEPFALDGLDQYNLRQEIVLRRLAGQTRTHIAAMLAGQGLLPQGSFAGLALQESMAAADALAGVLHVHVTDPFPPQEVQLPLKDILLCGWLDKLYSGGRVVWSGGQASARLFVNAWLGHLALAALAPGHIPVKSHICAWDSKAGVQLFQFDGMDAIAAQEQLTLYVQGFLQGQQEALPFFPKSALAWVEQMHKKNDVTRAYEAARKAWQGEYKQGGEGEDAAFVQHFPQNEPFDERFIHLAKLFLPMFKARKELKNARA